MKKARLSVRLLAFGAIVALALSSFGTQAFGQTTDPNAGGDQSNASDPTPSGTPGAAGEMVNVCHATGSATNPFVFIVVNRNSTDFQGHLMHAEQGNPPGGLHDIINGVNGTVNSAADCPSGATETPTAVVSETPTETPSAEVTATPTETPSGEATETPTETAVPGGGGGGGGGGAAATETPTAEVAGATAPPAPAGAAEATATSAVAGAAATETPPATETPQVAGAQATAPATPAPQVAGVTAAAPTATPAVAVLPSAGGGGDGPGLGALFMALVGMVAAASGYALRRRTRPSDQ